MIFFLSVYKLSLSAEEKTKNQILKKSYPGNSDSGTWYLPQIQSLQFDGFSFHSYQISKPRKIEVLHRRINTLPDLFFLCHTNVLQGVDTKAAGIVIQTDALNSGKNGRLHFMARELLLK